jgi:ribokinase
LTRSSGPSNRLEGISDIQNHFGQPAVFGLFDFQPVIGDGLHLVNEQVTCRIVRFAAESSSNSAFRNGRVKLARQELFRLEQKQQFVDPIDEQVFSIRSSQIDVDRSPRLDRVGMRHDNRQKGSPRFRKKRIEIVGADAQTEVGRVVEDFEHGKIRGDLGLYANDGKIAFVSQVPQRSRPRIAVVGSINMDLVVRSARLPRPGETIIGRQTEELPGGKGANQAVAAVRLEADVSMIGRVGDDAFGERLRAALRRERIDVSRVVVTPQCASGLAVVAVEDSGENAITVIPGANGRLTPADVRAASHLIGDADVLLLQLEVPLDSVLSAIELAREYDTLVILDPAPAPASFPPQLLSVDVACPNETEAAALTGIAITDLAGARRAAQRLREMGTRHAIITLGRQGAILGGADGECQEIPSFEVAAIDTTAAGDAFAAALAVRLARGKPISDAVRYACAAGALAASQPGAQPAMPTAGAVAQLAPQFRQ